MFRLVIICGCVLAAAQAGPTGGHFISAGASAGLSYQHGTVAIPAVSSTSSNIIRGIGNSGAISAYSKSVDTAFSSVRKSDVRINNPGVTGLVTAAAAPGVLSYAASAPALAVSDAALAGPYGTTYAGQGFAAPALGLGLNGHNFALNGHSVALNGHGVALNGLALNGLAYNGINGVGVNGIAVNGLGVNGIAVNGLGVNGLALNGVGVNGIAVNGLGHVL